MWSDCPPSVSKLCLTFSQKNLHHCILGGCLPFIPACPQESMHAASAPTMNFTDLTILECVKFSEPKIGFLLTFQIPTTQPSEPSSLFTLFISWVLHLGPAPVSWGQSTLQRLPSLINIHLQCHLRPSLLDYPQSYAAFVCFHIAVGGPG